MDTRKIGSLDATVVGLGCNNFGRRIDEEQTRQVVDAALEAGVTFFDTADIYGGTKSEEFLGRILKGRRDQVVLATKFGHEVDPDRKGAHPTYIRQACEDSLRRLQTDVIDLYQLHTPDANVPIADTLGALDELVRAGKVREIGCSNFSVNQLAEADKVAPGAKFVSVQNEYSILMREPEAGVLDECARTGVGLIPYFPLASGLLTGKYRKGQEMPSGTRIAPDSDKLEAENLDRIERLIAFAEERGRTLLELAFGYLLSVSEVTSVIAGATRPDQVQANAGACHWRLTPDERDAVRALI